MREAIAEPRTELAAHAPRIVSTKIHPDFIGMVIGKGGETIRGLEADYEVQIDIEEDGTIRIYGTNGELAEQCRLAIEAMTKEVEVGDEYTGKVVKITDFGAFVELRKGVDGLLHVSRILPRGHRLQSAAQVIDRGDTVKVTVAEVDKDKGRIGLTAPGQARGRHRDHARAAGRGGRAHAGASARGAPAQAQAATAAARAAASSTSWRGRRTPAPPPLASITVQRYTITTLDGGERVVVGAGLLGTIRRDRHLDRRGLARRDADPGRHVAPHRAPAVQGLGALLDRRDRPDLRRPGRRAERGHRPRVHRRLRARPRRPPARRPST